jgi:hypothetical protein
MPRKPLPPELTAPLYTPEALMDLADKIGQFSGFEIASSP